MKLKPRSKLSFRDWNVFLITVMPIIDCINGYFQKNFLSIIGPVYRLLIMLIAFCVIIKWGSKKTILFIFSIISYFYLHDILFIIFDNENNNFSIIAGRTLKYIYMFLIAEALRTSLKKRKISLFDIENIFSYLSWLYPILLIFPKLIGASGTSMYMQAGYKGFYYSGNAVSIAMVVSLFIAINCLYKKPCIKNTFRAILCLSVQLLIGAKTNYIFVVLILVFFAAKSINITKWKNIKILIILGILSAVGVMAIKYWFASEITKILVRQSYLFSAYNKNLVQYLTSNRSTRIKEQLDLFQSSPFYIIFGMGYRQTLKNNFVEMDYFDLLFRYGMAITIVLIIYYISFLRKSNKKEYLILFLMVQAFAMLAGHVFCDAMSGTLLALIIAHISYNDKNIASCRSYI